MYTINHMWIDNINGVIPEARSKITGLYGTMEQAKVGLNEWFMKVPNNGCKIEKYTDEQYSFTSPDGKTRGFVEIQEIEGNENALILGLVHFSYKVIDNVYTIVYTKYKKGDDFMQATIQKWGNSQGIRIPKAFLEALGMMENDLVELNRVDNNIVITKVKEKKDLTLEDIFKDYDGEYAAEEFDWGFSCWKGSVVMYNPKQGDIVFLDFSLQSGHEQAGRRPGVVISNEQFFMRTKFAVVCPITNTSNKFPLHIPLDNRTKTTGVILTEHMKCLDVISRNIQFIEKMPEDLLVKTLAYVKAFF